MTTLYVDRRSTALKLDGEALAFYEDDTRIGTVPLAPLDRVVLRGEVTLQSNVLGKLGAMGIGVVVLSGRKSEATLLLPQPHADATRRLTQFHLAQDSVFCLTFAQQVLAEKLTAQRDVLLSLAPTRLFARQTLTACAAQLDQGLQSLLQQPHLAGLRGVEGAAASQYFAGLAAALPAALGFTGRNRRPPRDPFNAVLSLAYTLLQADAVQTLYAGGLDPYVGFLHGVSYGRESLACDVIEPLRPLVDGWLVGCFAEGTLRVEDFSTTASGCLLGKAGRVRFYSAYEAACVPWRRALTQATYALVNTLKAHGLPTMPQARDPITTED